MKIAPFMVATNATIAELAQRRPTSRAELLGIKGIGPTKAERFGDELLAILQSFPE
jgi:DNA helicase-2/ATP-dependent DNA helicase PcrA